MSDFTITIGKPPVMTAEQRQDRARRAREVLEGAGWAFDEFMSAKNRDLLAVDTTDPLNRGHDQVLRIHADIRIAAELKAHLIRIVETQQAEEKLHERHQRTE